MADPVTQMVNPFGVALPERTTTYHGTQKERVIADPGALEALTGMANDTNEKREALLRKNIEEEKLRQQAAADAEAQAKLQEDQLAAREKAIADRQRDIDAAVAERGARRAEMEKNATITSFWGDENRPSKAPFGRILEGFLKGMADNAWTRAGGQGESPSTRAINAEIARDRAEKVEKFERSKYFHDLSKQDVEEAQKAKADFLHELDERHLMAQKVAAGKIAALAKRMGLPAAQADADATMADTNLKDQQFIARERAYLATKEQTQAPTIVVNENKPGAGAAKAATGDIEAVGNLENALGNLGKLEETIKSADEKEGKGAGWEEYSEVNKEWAKRKQLEDAPLGIGKGVKALLGLAGNSDITQAYKSRSALDIHSRIEQAINFLGRDLGGVLTPSDVDRIKSRLGTLGQDKEGFLKTVGEIRSDMQRKRDLYLKNKDFGGVTQPAAPPVSPSTPTLSPAPQPGAALAPKPPTIALTQEETGPEIQLAKGGVVSSRKERAAELESCVGKLRGMSKDHPERAGLEKRRRQLLGVA